MIGTTTLVVTLAALSLPPAGEGRLLNLLRPNQRREQSQLLPITDYATAYRTAKREHKQLLVFFHPADKPFFNDARQYRALSNAKSWKQLDRFVLASVPLTETLKQRGTPKRVVDHAAFADLRSGGGVAIVDLEKPKAATYGQVVSLLRFNSGGYYTFKPAHVPMLLELPRGTLTQRSLILAVRIHPEHPNGASGKFHQVLAKEAMSHSRNQAGMGVQGHHNWESRFHQINARLPGDVSAQEVVAESWPGEDLMDACVDCVASWRQSSGHWSAVRGRHPLFGFDIQRGGNGIWYATGLFGRRN
ncbi:MAG: hypothetical protein SGJ19_16570 [Planctomycetia bacterium]|nr:hypothetical protein [Planctomycetia bacterium]